MNPLLQIALTLALVTGGIVTYHVAVDRSEGPQLEVDLVADRDLAALEARVDALENAAPLLRGSVDNGARLLDLVARVKTLETTVPERVAGRTEAAAPPAADPPFESGVEGAEAKTRPTLTPAQQNEVKRLVDGAVRERMGGRGADRLNRTLAELDIELTKEQREKLDAAWSAHRESIGELWRTGRESGLSRDEVRSQMDTLTQKLTQGLAEFIPAGDAEAITGALSTMGRGPGGGRRPGR